ncbi:MAG TPA: DUF3810 domain-containing protein [Leeuwenhoekiella sp.]|nr:DUF3810 domain-containing protein [Leeuwenhoekiella sp.]
MKLKKPLLYSLIFLLQLVGLRILRGNPEFVERYYSTGIYPYIGKALRYLLGWISFSMGDLLYAVLIVWLLFSLYKLIKKRFGNWLKFITEMLLILNIIYICFHLLWGFNYYRLPLHQALQIGNDYDTEELGDLTRRLIDRANQLHTQLQPDDSAAVVFPFKIQEVFDKTPQGYTEIEESFPKLDYPPKSIKNSLFRYPLSVMGFGGYLNPITNEAQVNGLIPGHRWPLVSCHEQGHQLGFAKENEANFIGVLASTNNSDPYFKYSGYIFALRYCLNEFYIRDPEAAEKLKPIIKFGILANYKESYDFWARFENPLEPIIEAIYGNYLVANNQPAGMQSYNYVVALLVNYYKDKKSLP